MHVTIRTRLVLWLLVAILPIVAAGFLFARQASSTITERAESDVSQLLQLEMQRLQDALDAQQADVTRVANRDQLVETMDFIATADPTDGESYRSALLSTRFQIDGALANSQYVEAMQLVQRNGDFISQTADFSREPLSPMIAQQAMQERRTLFGEAFRNRDGEDRLTIAVPITSTDGSVLGALLAETRLAPLVERSTKLEDFGASSESLIIQRTGDGEGKAVTLRRFDRDAAFSATIEAGSGSPSALSLSATGPMVVTATDYRGATTLAAIDYLDRTNWGVVVKIDRDEALAVERDLNRFAWVALLLTLGVIVVAWRRMVRPLGLRLRETADAAERVAGGNYSSRIGDAKADEIGDLSRGIDRLAQDLQADIAAREQAEDQLRYQANHDALTGLKNRQHAQAVIDNQRGRAPYTLLFLDLDGFKEINDVHGHGIGDEVLIALSKRLTRAFPKGTLISRWGGDEFLVMLNDADEASAADSANDLTRLFREPVATRAGQHAVGVSVGIGHSGAHISGAEVLLAADADMFRTKHNRRSSRTISPAVIRLVETALAEDRLEPFFQPVVKLDDNGAPQLAGAEALVRIRGTDGSTVPPAEFLPALGSNDLARSIDARVMTRSMAELGAWHRQGLVPPDFRVALNIGPASVNDSTVIDELAKAMATHDIKPHWVLIEIPETVEHVEPATLQSLKNMGVLLAIDDVGVAHSNLERMVDLDADIAKLDRRWIPDLATAEHSKLEVLKRLVDQCRSLDLDVIAEGVETVEQLEMLQELGVELFQGFFFGRPVSSFDFERTWCADFDTSEISTLHDNSEAV